MYSAVRHSSLLFTLGDIVSCYIIMALNYHTMIVRKLLHIVNSNREIILWKDLAKSLQKAHCKIIKLFYIQQENSKQRVSNSQYIL